MDGDGSDIGIVMVPSWSNGERLINQGYGYRLVGGGGNGCDGQQVVISQGGDSNSGAVNGLRTIGLRLVLAKRLIWQQLAKPQLPSG